jgi:N-acetylglucosamine-6-phosphate deacetylase
LTLRGFVDLHIHGAGKFDTRTEDPSHIRKIAEIHGWAGTGAILPTIYSASLPEMRKNMDAVRKAMEILTGSDQTARILGVHLEGPFLNPSRCGALDKGSFIKPTLPSFRKLLSGFEDLVKIMTIAPEIPGALKVIAHCRELGIKVNMGHSDATYEESINGKKAGATGVTHLFNAMRPFHQREPGLVGLGLIDEDLYIEVIADGFHLHPITLKLIFNRKRLERIIIVSDSVKGVKKTHPAVRKGILAGSGITLTESFRVLKDIGVPEPEITKAAINNPKRYLALK